MADGSQSIIWECGGYAKAMRNPPGVLFGIPEGFSFRYDALTNRISLENYILDDRTHSGIRDDDQEIDLGEIGYGASLTECLTKSDGGMENLTLELTRQCNCRCTYCLYSGAFDNRRKHSDDVMGAQTLLSALRFYKRHNSKCKNAQISFYGGEALLAFQLVRNAVSEATRLFANKPITFNISTNGLLLKGDVIRWLADNPNVSVVITVNGPRHDDCRVTRYGEPTLSSILRNVEAIRAECPLVWGKQVNFICNVSSLSEIRTIRNFYRDVIGKPPILVTGIHADHANETVANIVNGDGSSRLQLWYDLAKEYMKTGDPFLHALYRSRIRRIYTRAIYKSGVAAIASNCIPFISNCFVSTDGSINLCEKNCEMSLGNVTNGINMSLVRQLMGNALEVYNRKCRTCWAQRLCSICFADIDNLLRNNADIMDRQCRVERENIAADLLIFTEFSVFHSDVFERLYSHVKISDCKVNQAVGIASDYGIMGSERYDRL